MTVGMGGFGVPGLEVDMELDAIEHRPQETAEARARIRIDPRPVR